MITMKKHFLYILAFLLLSTVIVSCQKEWDAPEFQAPVYTGPTPNKTIQDIKNKHLVLDSYKLDSICSYDETFIVDGIVVSTDEGGNFYKTMVIQDETGAIELQLDINGLFNLYPIGQRVIIDCRGLIVGDYNRYYQIGWEYRKYSIGRINALHFDRYIHKDGLPSLSNLPEPLLGTQIDFNSLNDVGKLVKLENCQFDQSSWGKPLAYNEFVTEHKIRGPGIDSIIVRTSNYARFRSMKVPSEKVTLYGILTIYNETYQLMLRSKSDIIIDTTNIIEEVVESFVFDANSIGTGGWTTNPSTGSSIWFFQAWAGEEYMYHIFNNNNTSMDDWLISPTISLNSTANNFIRLFHKMDFAGIQDYYSIYYTTNTSAPFDPANYSPLPLISIFPSQFGNSNDISIAGIPSNNFKIAIRYNNNGGNQSAAWYIKKLEIIKK